MTSKNDARADREAVETEFPAKPDMLHITRCWQNNGWHAYASGPCFDTYEQAIKYRDAIDRDGWVVTRRSYGLDR